MTIMMTAATVMCDTEAKMPTIRKTVKTISMRARRISIIAMISSGALSVNTKTPLVWWLSGRRCCQQFLSHLWCDPHAHISSGMYPGCFMSSFHFYISFHFTIWVACMPLESPYHIICIYSIFGFQTIY